MAFYLYQNMCYISKKLLLTSSIPYVAYHHPNTFNTSIHNMCRRKKIPQREIRDKGVMSLPGLKYHLENCIAECRQRYMVQYCNCTVDFMYPTGSYPICNATGIRCIGEFAGNTASSLIFACEIKIEMQ